MSIYDQAYHRVFAAAGLTKQANLFQRGWDWASSAGSKVVDSFKRVGDAGNEYQAFRNFDQTDGLVSQRERLNKLDTHYGGKGPDVGTVNREAGEMTGYQNVRAQEQQKYDDMYNQARQQRNQRAWNYAKDLAPAAAVTGGVGAAGMYAAGPADTWQNDMKQMSNQTLGTDFGLQSRFSNWMS